MTSLIEIRCLNSSLVTFVIGAEKKEIRVHSYPIADLSQALNALINGEMLEATTGRVEWPDIDEDTFIRLCEFAYLRDYVAPSPSRFPHVETSLDPNKPAPKRQASCPSPQAKRQVMNFSQTKQQPGFSPSDKHVPISRPNATKIELPSRQLSIQTGDWKYIFSRNLVAPNQDTDSLGNTYLSPHNWNASQDFRPVFLGHVRLYLQADKYCIDSLRNLVLSKMFVTLETFKLFETGIAGITELVRFVYENTREDHEGSIDAMRNLVTRYVVSVVGQIEQTECFQNLLSEGGPFVTNFWKMIWSPRVVA
ncbi:hypothetical protein N7528_008170 [Penicillium herquei]|nr:hypothetical protein N7528_008170 [Penicillium herquei]